MLVDISGPLMADTRRQKQGYINLYPHVFPKKLINRSVTQSNTRPTGC